MSESIKAAVIHCSSTGFSAEIAMEISRAAEKAGAEVLLLKAAELAPEAAIASNEASVAHAAAGAAVPATAPPTWTPRATTPNQTRDAARHQPSASSRSQAPSRRASPPPETSLSRAVGAYARGVTVR